MRSEPKTEIDSPLLESQELFRFALDVSKMGVWELSLEDHTARRTLEHDRIFGYKTLLPTWSYETFLEHVLAEDRESVDCCFRAALENESDWSFECRIRRVDGEVRWIWAAGRHRRDDAGGRLMAGIVQDITEQKIAQLHLLESQRRLQAIMDAAPIGLSYSDDATCERITGNRALLSQFEIAPTDNISASATDPSAAGRQVRFYQQGREVADSELPLQRAVAERRQIGPIDLDVLLPSGRHWIAEAYGAPILDDAGQAVGGVAVTVDITQRRAIEEAIRKSEEALRDADRKKDEFLATLAHELRNPLAPIRNAVFVLRRLNGDDAGAQEKEKSLLAMVERQVQHLVRLVDDLLEVSRITTGKITLKKEPVELSQIVREALQTSEPLIQAQRHKVRFASSSEPLIVEGDPVRLTQIFTNLLNNAAKYTPPKGSIAITLRREGENAVVTINDSGIGILPEMLPKIFELFVQSHRVQGREQGGIGVGLALSRRLVEMHGGQLDARSEGPNRGSEFTVRLPLTRLHSSEANKGAEPIEVADMPRPRCLVVDDDKDVADSLALLLSHLGAETRVTYDGEAAIQVAEAFRPQLIFLDLGMPGIDGIAVARRIKRRSDGDEFKLIALTGWGQNEDRAKTREAGFDLHLTKPASVEEVSLILREAANFGAAAVAEADGNQPPNR